MNSNSDQPIRTPQLGVAPIEEVIAAMTVDEKLALIHGTGMGAAEDAEPVAGVVGGPVPGAAGLTCAIPRLGIPAIIMADGPAGIRIDARREGEARDYYATAFPTGTTLASTWNVDLMREVAHAIGKEGSEYGIDLLLAPGVNIQRNPLCGRNYEYYSEDPLLSGVMGVAFVQGVQDNGIGATVKHFAVNNQETNRYQVDVMIDQRALRETYLGAFERIIREAKPWAVMSAYNRINAQYASESRDLLTTILRDEWGFQGVVMTDWFAGRDYPAQLLAGCDLLMPGRKDETRDIRAALADGRMAEADLDRNVARMLNLILRCPTFRKVAHGDQPDLAAHAEVACRAAEEGIVLLRNEDGTLPLSHRSRVCLLGNASYETYISGTGSGEVNKAYSISIAEGLAGMGYGLDAVIRARYIDHIALEKARQPARTNFLQKASVLPEVSWNQEQIVEMAGRSDVAIITIGRNIGEGSDREVAGDYELKDEERTLIKSVTAAFHAQGKKVVVMLNTDGVLDVASWQDDVDAILLVWLPGQEAGRAIANIVSGRSSPCGKLPVTFPAAYADVPSSSTFPGMPAECPATAPYDEGIYVGYRHANTFDVAPAYAFGFGLSYTSFQITALHLSSATFDREIEVSAVVKNVGSAAGKEVVQLYLSAPDGTMHKPAEELRGFMKTRLLAPGEEQTVRFVIRAEDMASFDETGSYWVADAGRYEVKLGNSSRHFMQVAGFHLGRRIIVQRVNPVLAPKGEMKRLA